MATDPKDEQFWPGQSEKLAALVPDSHRVTFLISWLDQQHSVHAVDTSTTPGSATAATKRCSKARAGAAVAGLADAIGGQAVSVHVVAADEGVDHGGQAACCTRELDAGSGRIAR